MENQEHISSFEKHCDKKFKNIYIFFRVTGKSKLQNKIKPNIVNQMRKQKGCSQVLRHINHVKP